jgi:hypothetical protein
MPGNNGTGVARKLDIENLSKDIAALAKEIGRKVEGPVSERVVKRIHKTIKKIMPTST